MEHRTGPVIPAFEAGFVLGLLVGEGHFGGDGRQAQIVLRMHVRHEPIFHFLRKLFPSARLYGPYNHAGRHYFQLMWRGPALRYALMPLLEALPWRVIDAHSFGRYQAMKETYGLDDVPEFGLYQIADLPEAPGSRVRARQSSPVLEDGETPSSGS